MHGHVGNKVALLARLRKVEGQVRGVARMIEEDTYCIDVLTQVFATTRAIQTALSPIQPRFTRPHGSSCSIVCCKTRACTSTIRRTPSTRWSITADMSVGGTIDPPERRSEVLKQRGPQRAHDRRRAVQAGP